MTREVMPVAPAFLHRLLHGSDPLYAVDTLSSIWTIRANAGLPQLGLSRAEYFVQLCLIYSGEVGNGGHAQFFLNRGGRLVHDTLAALHETGLPELGASLASATALFPSGNVPNEPIDAERAFQRFTERHLAELKQLDQHAFRCLPVVDGRLMIYVRAHETQILVPETPLAARAGRNTAY